MDGIRKIILILVVCSFHDALPLQKIKKAWNDLVHPATPKALVEAAAKGDLAEIRRIVAAGVSPDAEYVVPGVMNIETPLDIAVIRGQIPAIAELVRLGADVNKKDEYGSTVLHTAAFLHNIASLEELIRQGADVNARNDGGGTPLTKAVNGMSPGRDKKSLGIIIDRLLQAGALPDKLFWENARQYPCVMEVCKKYLDEYRDIVIAYRKKKEELEKAQQAAQEEKSAKE